MTFSIADGLSARIADVLTNDPTADAIEFEGSWCTWGQLAWTANRVAALLDGPGIEVGVVLRNRPASIGAVLGVLIGAGCVVTITPARGRDRTRQDIEALDLPLVVGHPDDLADLLPTGSRATAISITELGGPLVVTRGSHQDSGLGRPGIAVRMLTSGTTGPPKRIDLGYETFESVLVGAKHYESNRGTELRQLCRGVAVVNSPLAHVGGIFGVLQCVTDGRPFAMLERFTVDGWVEVVRRHRPVTASLVPAALRMVLEADLDIDDLSSLRSVISGTAPLAPDDADAFFRKYGVPVLMSYGATEFGGSVAGWNIADHQALWSSKRGSVGRAHAGCELRIVDPDSGATLGHETEGVLEVKARQLAERGWVRTTDLARLDEDGFLWILGRADQAIIRGGFKIIPDDVRVALEGQPSVRGAVVIARDNRRLGALPVAAVELWPAADPITADELVTFISSDLTRYELPVEIRILDELPRTDSGKVDLRAVTAQLGEPSSKG
jgi:acyl-CoA synthetase (AMP-forming)/AMP-acid ligase II